VITFFPIAAFELRFLLNSRLRRAILATCSQPSSAEVCCVEIAIARTFDFRPQQAPIILLLGDTKAKIRFAGVAAAATH
jgi:hypothetical protein